MIAYICGIGLDYVESSCPVTWAVILIVLTRFGFEVPNEQHTRFSFEVSTEQGRVYCEANDA